MGTSVLSTKQSMGALLTLPETEMSGAERLGTMGSTLEPLNIGIQLADFESQTLIKPNAH